jgi:clan AA aspartic protease
MRYQGNMGVFRVPVKVRNWQNRYLPPDKRGEEVACEALVDSGAAELALPVEVIERLRLDPLGEVRVYTTDGGEHDYRVFGIAELEVQGRVCQVRAIELPHGAEPLLGAVPLEEMDWHIAPLEKRLLPNPRSPEKPLLPLAGARLTRRWIGPRGYERGCRARTV